MKVCGVGVARSQGHSWTPNLSNEHEVNVGTVLVAPHPLAFGLVGGKARRRLMPLGRGGGPVVVRAGESPAHGEGVQRVRGMDAKREDRW